MEININRIGENTWSFEEPGVRFFLLAGTGRALLIDSGMQTHNAKELAILDKLAGLVKQEFAKMDIEEGMYGSLVHSITASKVGKYVFHYDAPALIVTANQKDYGNNIADCACPLENMMLMANALDLGSCWINQLRWLNENAVLTEYLRVLGLEDNERVYGALAVGYPATEDALPVRRPLPRKGNPVTWVE